MWLDVLLVGIGGFLGAVSRFLVLHFIPIPLFGILVVNMAGSFFAGLFLGLPLDFFPLTARIFVVTGFMGAFTTFSAFSVETVLLLKSGAYATGFLNIFLNVFLCILWTFLGFICSGLAVR